jgi:chromosomal replication initiator protein
MGRERAPGGAEEVATDDMDIVSALRTALAGRVGIQRFELWFGSRTRLELAGDALTIHAPSQFFVNWIRANFRQDIEAVCGEVLGSCPNLQFQIDAAEPELKPAPVAAVPTPQSSTSAPQPIAASIGQPQPAASNRRSFANFQSFVVGPSNRLAYASAEMVVQRPGELSPLVIWGPTGVGKTHLLEGIWTAARKADRQKTIVYLSAEQFVGDFLQALRGTGLPSFRRKYRGVDLLLIDDLQFFCGKRYTQIELLYTIDTLLRERHQIVLACDRPPSEMTDLGPELVARLESGVVCRLESPEHQTRRGIVAKMAERLHMTVPGDVQEFIAARLTRHAREISGALCRLHATSQAWQRPITLSMAQEALGDMVQSSSRVVRLVDIEKAVCEAFGLDSNCLQSERKAQKVSHPRMLAMWLARKYTRAALSEIGQFFGRRSHSTVISAQKRVDGWLSEGATLRLADHALGVEEAIRQVEQFLQAG